MSVLSRRLPFLALPLLAWLSAASCNKVPEYPFAPEITPKSVMARDSLLPGGARLARVTVTINWQDGDGDLGDNDTTANHYNYFLKMEKRIGSNYKLLIPTAGANSLNGHFPPLAPDDRAQALRGDLSYVVNSGFTIKPPQVAGTIDGQPARLAAGDVLRFKVYIKDRAGHISNEITTQDVTL